ncbi:hypothetical protein AK812_SmicGene9228 [Symbiodinium microadriaticum]|uniref:Uncharacterized protein n=1 Tax=Symbiodinium microadriaticum TaxID=2951 RepID=A0A1Q9EIY7_SYMMI|nr:hypothetical protein AK812_SmicGene9228 [Symbiodinium microadriaticum]
MIALRSPLVSGIWHAHQLHPWKYEEETAELCGRLLPHDDSVNDRSSGSQLSVRWEQTKQAWKEIFRDEGPYRSGSMYRGTVTAQERLSREQQWNYMRSVIGPDVYLGRMRTVALMIESFVAKKVAPAPAWAEPQRSELKWVHRKDLDSEVVHGRSRQKSFSYVEVMKDPHKLLPVVTAHAIDSDQLPDEMQETVWLMGLQLFATRLDVSAEAATCPTLDKQEKAYLIRVAGEDVAVLVGKRRRGPVKNGLAGTEKIHIDLAEGKVWGFTNTISMAEQQENISMLPLASPLLLQPCTWGYSRSE